MNYSLLSSTYEKLFQENYETFCENIRQIGDEYYLNKEYCLFFPSCGSTKKENIKFIIYGQAQNKWTPNFHINEDFSPNILKKAIEWSNIPDDGNQNPIDWINKEWYKATRKYGYHPHRSFFWKVSYKLINCYNNGIKHLPDEDTKSLDSDDWCNYLIWSNLMKIAPADGGNPTGPDWNSQLTTAIKLFEEEISEINPAYVILLTNWDWAEAFINKPSYKIEKILNQKFIVAKGKFENTTIIVTNRFRRWGGDQECVNEILNFL